MINPKKTGFTLVELIVVLVLIGILALTALPRFFSRQTFDARGFYDQSLAMVRYGQKVAIAQHRLVFVNVASGSSKLCLTYIADTTCTSGTGVTNPADQTFFVKTAPAGITFSASISFSFSAIGKPNPDAQVLINIVGDGMTRPITVEQETGYAH